MDKYNLFGLFLGLFFLYVPFSSVCYYSLGTCLSDNIIFTLSPGFLQTLAQLVLLVHLSAAVPITISPANQYFEVCLYFSMQAKWLHDSL